MRFLLLAVLLCSGLRAGATGVISGPGDEPAERAARGKRAPPAEGGGDIQVGPAVSEEPAERPAPAQSGSRVPGIFPVYEAADRWMLVDRRKPGAKAGVAKGAPLLVIGSKGVAEFRVERATQTYLAACEGFKPVRQTAYYLTAASAKSFAAVGSPIIALKLKPGARFDPEQAWFYPLRNEIKESTYARLLVPLRAAAAADLRSGAFQIKLDDEVGHKLAQNPEPEQIQYKIDFGSKIRFAGMKEPFLLVEGAQVSNTYRRCMRLVDGDRPVGACADMPHELLAETRQLQFVAYDPRRSGNPFILAYTREEPKPLWGHERWGFSVGPKGPAIFLRDALDPRCRESF